MSLLYLRRGFHLDEFEFVADASNYIRDHCEIAGTKCWLIQRGRRVRALRQHSCRLGDGCWHAFVLGDNGPWTQSLYPLVKRPTLQDRNVRCDRSFQRLVNLKPKALVALKPRIAFL